MGNKQRQAVYVLFWKDREPTQPIHKGLTAELKPWWDIHSAEETLGAWAATNKKFIETSIRNVAPLKGMLVVHSKAETAPDFHGVIDAPERWTSWALHEYRRRNDLFDQTSEVGASDFEEGPADEALALQGEADPVNDPEAPSSVAGMRRRGILPQRSYDAVEMKQEEDLLVARYAKSRGVQLGTINRTHDDGRRIQIDALDGECLIEAKSKAHPEFVRMAIGQVLDYRRTKPHPTSSMILLPEWPFENLIQLANEYGIIVCAERPDGTFETRG